MLAEVSRCIQAITTAYLRTGVHAAESGMKRTEAIILSMTKQERRKPEILNGSRRMRIANGSGVKVVEVNRLLTREPCLEAMSREQIVE